MATLQELFPIVDGDARIGYDPRDAHGLVKLYIYPSTGNVYYVGRQGWQDPCGVFDAWKGEIVWA